MHSIETEYDYIIVGSGSAGSIVANRLSADKNVSVLVLEAGGPDTNFWLKLPVGYFRTIYDERFSRIFKTEPSEGDGHRGIDWPRGKVVGGSSSINGLIYIRGQQEDFNDWSDLGANGWAFKDVLPHFKTLENCKTGVPEYRGRLGEMSVSNLRNDHPYCQAWMDAAEQFGLPKNPDFNGESNYGVGAYQLTLAGRWRASAARCFLHPALKRPNLHIQTNALATRVTFDGNKANGVEWLQRGKLVKARATQEVILCGGALQTPQILQLSGIGPADLLKSHNIPVIVDSPEVGENLQDHYQMRVVVRLKENISFNNDVRNPLKLMQMGARWLLDSSGPLTVGAGQVGGSACSSYAKNDRPDIQFNVMPLSVDKPGVPLHRYPGFTTSVWQCHPASRGSVQITSKDPTIQPKISPNYFSQSVDRQVLVDGVKIIREIHSQPAFRDLWIEEKMPGNSDSSDSKIWDQIRHQGGTVFHCVGTCRMGSDDRAVVDPSLRVKGVEGLRVIDASVMPKITSANTNAATLMIGEKGAFEILNS